MSSRRWVDRRVYLSSDSRKYKFRYRLLKHKLSKTSEIKPLFTKTPL